MQEGSGNFDAPYVAAGEIAHFVVRAVRKASPDEHGARPLLRITPPDPVQSGVIDEILHDGEFKIERARLEDDAETAQRLAALPANIIAKDLDRPGARDIEARD